MRAGRVALDRQQRIRSGCVQPCRIVGVRALARRHCRRAAGRRASTPRRHRPRGRRRSGGRGGAAGRPRRRAQRRRADRPAMLCGAVAAARARNVTIDAVPLGDGDLRDAALTRLDAPAAVHAGRHDLAARDRALDGDRAGDAVVARDGGKAASQVMQLHQGDNPFTLSYTAAERRLALLPRARRCSPATSARRTTSSARASSVGAPPRVDRGVRVAATRGSRRS